MDEGIYILAICDTSDGALRGWQTPIIFTESQEKEMDKIIAEAKSKKYTVATTWIYGHAVAPLRQHFAAEASKKTGNKPELIPLDISSRSAIEVLRDPPTLQEKK